eukprot:5191582-Amphidinium_carterae.1
MASAISSQFKRSSCPARVGSASPGDTESAANSSSVSAGSCAGQHSTIHSDFDSDDGEFILVSELLSQPSPSSSTSLPSVVLPCARSRIRSVPASCSVSSTQCRAPYPGLLSEFCGLPCGPVYVVWAIPGSLLDCPSGIHFGAEAWLGILSIIPGGSYRSGQDRLRALPESRDIDEASDHRLQ